MGDDQHDSELVRRVQSGERNAYDLLVRKHQYRIAALVRRHVRDPAEAEDVVQETFLRAWRALPQFRGEAQFYTWLYRIAVNTARNHLASLGRAQIVGIRRETSKIRVEAKQCDQQAALLQAEHAALQAKKPESSKPALRTGPTYGL